MVFNFGISGQSHINENYIDVKLESVTKVDQRNTAALKNTSIILMFAKLFAIVFFLFMDNLQPSRSRILDTGSIKSTHFLKNKSNF